MFSRTVISRNRLWFCGTWTTPRSRICRGFLPTRGTPRKVMLPRRDLSRPLMVASSVDLPEPFGPTIQVSPPSATVNDTPCSTSLPPYPATTPSTTSTASPLGGSMFPGARSYACTALLRLVVAGAKVGVEHLGVVAYQLGRSGRDHRAVVQDHDRVAQAHHEIHVVLYDQEGLAVRVQLPDLAGDDVDQRRVHPAGRLVEQQDLRIGHQHVGQLEQLALAVGECLGQCRGVRGYPDEVEQVHPGPPCGTTSGPG